MGKGVALMGHRIGSIYIHIVTDHFALTHNKVDLNFSRGHYDKKRTTSDETVISIEPYPSTAPP